MSEKVRRQAPEMPSSESSLLRIDWLKGLDKHVKRMQPFNAEEELRKISGVPSKYLGKNEQE